MTDFQLDEAGAPALKTTTEQAKDHATVPASAGSSSDSPALGSTWRPDAQRRRDAVVDAARTIDDLSPDGVREFVTQRWQGRRALEDADIERFVADARSRRIDDVADALSHRIGSSILRATRGAHVTVPRGFAKNAIQQMSDVEVEQLVTRLRGRGWTTDQIRRSTRKLDPGQRLPAAMGLAPSKRVE